MPEQDWMLVRIVVHVSRAIRDGIRWFVSSCVIISGLISSGRDLLFIQLALHLLSDGFEELYPKCEKDS